MTLCQECSTMRYYQPRPTSFSFNTARRGPASLGNPTGPAFRAGTTMREKNGRDIVCYLWCSRVARLRSSDCSLSAYPFCDSPEKYTRLASNAIMTLSSLVVINACIYPIYVARIAHEGQRFSLPTRQNEPVAMISRSKAV